MIAHGGEWKRPANALGRFRRRVASDNGTSVNRQGPIRPRIPGARSGVASRRRQTFAPESAGVDAAAAAEASGNSPAELALAEGRSGTGWSRAWAGSPGPHRRRGTSRMVAHYSAGATAERGAVARYL